MGNSGKERKRMAVNLRERPPLTGKDAEKFIARAKKNEQFLKKYSERKTKEYHDKLSKYRD